MNSNGLQLAYTKILKRAPLCLYNAISKRSRVCDPSQKTGYKAAKKTKSCMEQVKALHDRETHPVSHVIMDLDGVVLDSTAYNILAHEEYLMKWKKALKHKTKLEIMGLRNEDAGKIVTDHYDMPFNEHVYAHGVWQIQRGLYHHAKMTKGVDDVICYFLSQKMPIALVSSADTKAFKILYSRLKGLKDNFCHVVHGDEVVNGKPSPDLFIKTAKMFYAAPRVMTKYLVIDGSHSGALAAKAAGMQVILCTEERLPKEMQETATVVLNSIEKFDPTEFHLPAKKK